MTDPVERIETVLRELSELHTRRGQVEETLRKRLDPLLEQHRPPRVTERPEWATELLDAARRDLSAAAVLAEIDMTTHATVVGMLLQMVFEKLAKAHLARTQWSAFVAHRRSHAAATRFTQSLKRQRRLLPSVGPQSPKVLAWIEMLTDAHPALAKSGPHLEYPWERADRVYSPARDLPIVALLSDARSSATAHLIRFAKHFVDNFDDIFG